jgi:hypothetical protein
MVHHQDTSQSNMKKEKYSSLHVNTTGILCCYDTASSPFSIEIELDCLFEVDGQVYFCTSKPSSEEQSIWPEGDEI